MIVILQSLINNITIFDKVIFGYVLTVSLEFLLSTEGIDTDGRSQNL